MCIRDRVVRDNGAVPATIAIIGGKLKVGISKEEIDHLGRKGLNVIKASRRDIPVLAAKGCLLYTSLVCLTGGWGNDADNVAP